MGVLIDRALSVFVAHGRKPNPFVSEGVNLFPEASVVGD
jgi:hypothetical protein